MEIIHEIAVLELAQNNPWVINFHEIYEIPSHVILVLECATLRETFDQLLLIDVAPFAKTLKNSFGRS